MKLHPHERWNGGNLVKTSNHGNYTLEIYIYIYIYIYIGEKQKTSLNPLINDPNWENICTNE